MKLFLDTHVLLWWLRDNPKLGPRARALIADSENEVMVSIASLWEIAVRYRIGKIEISGASVAREVAAMVIAIVHIETAHLDALEALPRHSGHGDPFDHLILAQAKVEGARLMTSDKHMRAYGVHCISTF